jgi:hypothetical protein
MPRRKGDKWIVNGAFMERASLPAERAAKRRRRTVRKALAFRRLVLKRYGGLSLAEVFDVRLAGKAKPYRTLAEPMVDY